MEYLPDLFAVTVTDRGFKHLEPLVDDYRGQVKIYESSDMAGPHIWLSIEENPAVLRDSEAGKAHSHLTLEQTEGLIARLRFAVDNHYQNEDHQDFA